MNSDKSWLIVNVQIAREAEDLASDLLFELGTTGIVMPEESATKLALTAYFDKSKDADQITQLIETAFAEAGLRESLLSISVSEIADQDWMEKWKEGFEPIEIGQRLIIAPSWKLPEKTEGREVISIDPGMAFGTGTHETTQLCLEAIEHYWQGGSLLDVGTGTGILAMAALKLAPDSQITAIDIDPLAVEVARENAEINGIAESIEIREGKARDYAGKRFDMVVANLTAEVVISLMTDLVACLSDSGLLVLSGILVPLARDVERSVLDAEFVIIERREAGEWAAIIARKD